MTDQPLFESTGMDDPLGLWAPAAGPAGLSFAVDDLEPDPVFRVSLPEEDTAPETFGAGEAYIAQVNAALENVPARLDGLVQRTQARRRDGQGAGVSFDVLALEERESGPEGQLLALLGDAEQEGRRAGGEVSFGLVEETSAAWQQARAGFEALMTQINREVLHFAWVETSISGSLIARTTVGWTGDADTVYLEDIREQQVVLHGRTLRIVTQTRSLRLRLFITIASGAAKISTLIATPAGALLALPATYQYVMQIIAQVKQLQSIRSS